jgi:hypothetical protein
VEVTDRDDALLRLRVERRGKGQRKQECREAEQRTEQG